MAAKDWRKIFQQYPGQWIALQADEVTVIAAAPSLHEARQKANDLGFTQPIMTKMPSDLRVFAG